MASMQEKSHWYVYELIDPRTDTVFYVGKGKGQRMHQHEQDARKGICSKKTNKINSIWSDGYEIHKRQVAFFWDESAAYDHETDVIEGYGLENLTNIMKGGSGSWSGRLAKRKIERQKAEPKPIVLHDWIAKQDSETLFQRFADWFSMGLHKSKGRLKVTIHDERLKFHAAITEGLHNSILPAIWKMIVGNEKAQEAFAIRMKPYRLEFVNGSA
jgi:hypothetical protein